MVLAGDQPWFHAAVNLLDVRRQDRLLAVCVEVSQARDLAALVGNRGEAVLVLTDRRAAEQLAALDLPQVHVIARSPDGSEHFGAFDAMLVAPTTGPTLTSGAYADLARANLRPGGRFVIDLPGLDMVPDLTAACGELGLAPARLAPLRGLSDDHLGDALRSAGLRSVNGVLGAHLLHMGSPAELVAMFAAALALDAEESLQVARAIARRRGGADRLDALVHRTRLQGLR